MMNFIMKCYTVVFLQHQVRSHSTRVTYVRWFFFLCVCIDWRCWRSKTNLLRTRWLSASVKYIDMTQPSHESGPMTCGIQWKRTGTNKFELLRIHSGWRNPTCTTTIWTITRVVPVMNAMSCAPNTDTGRLLVCTVRVTYIYNK